MTHSGHLNYAMIKTITLKQVLSIFMLFLFMSCDTLDELTKFDISFEESITIPATSPIDLPFTISTPEIETNSNSEFSSNDTAKDLVEEIKLTELKLTLKNPSSEDFSFLETIEIYIAADDLPDTKLAWNPTPISNDSNVMFLDTSNEDLKAYIFKDSFYLKVKTGTDEVLTQDYDIDINTVFFVDAKILGL
ncbi:hypothetical protein [Formosa sp. PL04]|uniref:hypothetical protein n=1 Tax=Formosa sp. PL04 TaxID=3081755 RepID=UPI002980FF08|nr:hypothetical protein [Formosa sp. PL04]MDW5288666.1 hypothetical protein [Formosa sp. PL04]